jgi:hypothetical protein
VASPPAPKTSIPREHALGIDQWTAWTGGESPPWRGAVGHARACVVQGQARERWPAGPAGGSQRWPGQPLRVTGRGAGARFPLRWVPPGAPGASRVASARPGSQPDGPLGSDRATGSANCARRLARGSWSQCCRRPGLWRWPVDVGGQDEGTGGVPCRSLGWALFALCVLEVMAHPCQRVHAHSGRCGSVCDRLRLQTERTLRLWHEPRRLGPRLAWGHLLGCAWDAPGPGRPKMGPLESARLAPGMPGVLGHAGTRGVGPATAGRMSGASRRQATRSQAVDRSVAWPGAGAPALGPARQRCAHGHAPRVGCSPARSAPRSAPGSATRPGPARVAARHGLP